MLQIELSRRYYEDVVKPALRQQLPAALDLCAFVDFFGDSGSFGWDDDISRDEDWGPRVMVIVPDDGPSSLYDDLLNIARELPTSVAGLEANERPDASSAGPSWTGPRMRLRRLSDHFIYGDPPLENLAWLRTDEHRLFAMVSGSVLNDPTGRFVSRLARWRRTYYPDDVWYHRLAGAPQHHGQAMRIEA